MENLNRDLIDFIDLSPTAFHTVHNVKMRLIEDGYTELFEGDKWTLERSGAYFVTKGDASLIAFRVPEDGFDGFQIAACHTDSPAFKLKPNFELTDSTYLRLSTEKYGGPVLSTWLDRPLGIAGRVMVKVGKTIESRLVALDRDVALIPSVAPHLSGEEKLSMLLDMCPLIGGKDSAGALTSLIADSIGVEKEDIVSHDLYLVNRDKGRLWGVREEFVSAPRLDDLQCVYTSLIGFLISTEEVNMPVLALFNSEEVGSTTHEGAGSAFLSNVLRRISLALGGGEEEYLRLLSNSFMVSADNAHAVHPNHPELTDSLNKAYLNSGLVLKSNSQMRYITEGEGSAVFTQLCRMADLPFSSYTNRSDKTGGSTLGHIAISNVPVTGVDIGLPELSMHSAFETAGARDSEYAVRFFETYFSSYINKKRNTLTID